jgi:hypothetical protein
VEGCHVHKNFSKIFEEEKKRLNSGIWRRPLNKRGTSDAAQKHGASANQGN